MHFNEIDEARKLPLQIVIETLIPAFSAPFSNKKTQNDFMSKIETETNLKYPL